MPSPPASLKLRARIIIHGGAGNIKPQAMSEDYYQKYRDSLLSIVTATDAYMRTPKKRKAKLPGSGQGHDGEYDYPTALEIATFALVRLEDDPLFNSGRGAVFTRDGVNELEASVMVSRGFAKRGVGVTGLRTVKNPVLLAKAMLEHGERDIWGNTDLSGLLHSASSSSSSQPSSETALGTEDGEGGGGGGGRGELDIPSAQGHTLIHGRAAEQLARRYGLETVDPSYYFTQKRWDEHIRGLENEKKKGASSYLSASWRSDEYIPQGTCGAVACDENGVVCAATSTGGITNKLTGRIGDTPVVGAGFWAEEWVETKEASWKALTDYIKLPGPVVQLSSNLRSFLADCLPTPFLYTPLAPQWIGGPSNADIVITRSVALSGTGNGDSFLRVAAARSVVAMARWAGLPASEAVSNIAGPSGELQRSAGPRWGKTGEGEGGMIGIECSTGRDKSGTVVYGKARIIQAHNCAGMFRAWIDDIGSPTVSIWREEEDKASRFQFSSASDEKMEYSFNHQQTRSVW
ncbi:L-asparaginase precursor [Xylariaceae sp. FL0594]|nr:L-asparaginase precursor [Xylariaceae sp. FL0594]